MAEEDEKQETETPATETPEDEEVKTEKPDHPQVMNPEFLPDVIG